ncbi:hypothetical protein B0H17DRAFT_1126870 [Mycena rosella]|uniref:Uncharacterized protein n=1 Tax=Mycena rosella TaxID=1033263 RepID=A0AAD7M7A1_MYCRO|nr:hypothetical protein B0H17DRAFT_1126870 [Mycena rosella]
MTASTFFFKPLRMRPCGNRGRTLAVFIKFSGSIAQSPTQFTAVHAKSQRLQPRLAPTLFNLDLRIHQNQPAFFAALPSSAVTRLTFSLSHRTSTKPPATVPRHQRQPDHAGINYPRFNSTELFNAPSWIHQFILKTSLLNFEIISRFLDFEETPRAIPAVSRRLTRLFLLFDSPPPTPPPTPPSPRFFFFFFQLDPPPTPVAAPPPHIRRWISILWDKLRREDPGYLALSIFFGIFATEKCAWREPHQSGIAANTHKEADLDSPGSWLGCENGRFRIGSSLRAGCCGRTAKIRSSLFKPFSLQLIQVCSQIFVWAKITGESDIQVDICSSSANEAVCGNTFVHIPPNNFNALHLSLSGSNPGLI